MGRECFIEHMFDYGNFISFFTQVNSARTLPSRTEPFAIAMPPCVRNHAHPIMYMLLPINDAADSDSEEETTEEPKRQKTDEGEDSGPEVSISTIDPLIAHYSNVI